MLYSHTQPYVYIYNYMRKHSQHNIRTSMNERTHFFIKIYLSHFIRKGWWWLCVRGELETETDCYILTKSSSRDHSSTSSSSWLCCSTVGRWGPKAFVWSWHSLRRHPISNCDWNWTRSDSATDLTNQVVCGTWLYNCLSCTYFPWAYASAPNSTTSTGQGDIPISSTGCTCYLPRCISWLTARSRVSM